MNYTFKARDIKRIIEHWLATEPNSYIGVSYGRNLSELLFGPLNEDKADTLLTWLREDIPVLNQVVDGELQVVSEVIGLDQRKFYIKIGQILIPIQDNQGE